MKPRAALLEIYNKFELALKKQCPVNRTDQFQVRINDCMALLRYLLGDQPVFGTISGIVFKGEKDLNELIIEFEAQKGRSSRRRINKNRQIQIDKRFQDLIALLKFISGDKKSFIRLNVFLKE